VCAIVSKDIFNCIQVFGVDYSSEMLGVAKVFTGFTDALRGRPLAQSTGYVQYVQANAESTGLPAGTFDIVSLNFVLHEVRRCRIVEECRIVEMQSISFDYST
jgi:ubiquinone/menaquinone biosynthesis C-methylase UbiE